MSRRLLMLLVVAPIAASAATIERNGPSRSGEPSAAERTATAVEARPPSEPGADFETIGLPRLAEAVSQDPQVMESLAEAVRTKLGGAGTGWPGLGELDAQTKERLIRAVRESDKSFLDSFPTMSVAELKAFTAMYGESRGPTPVAPPGPREETLELNGRPQEAEAGAFLKPLGDGFFTGDRTLHGLASAYGDNARVAGILNRLSLNEPGREASFVLRMGDGPGWSSVGAFLYELLKTGHEITASDKRFFANFGGLWREQDGRWSSVMTPLYVDTGLQSPDGRPIEVPVSHSQLELHVAGPRVNADLLFYFGIDGAAMFYPKATENKPWVGGRTVREWRGVEAVELAERAAIARRELKLKAERYGLPAGGYGPLGVCNDIEAMITGIPNYPMIRDPRYYQDGMTIDRWASGLPVDGASAPEPGRVFDSLPAAPDEILPPRAKEMARRLASLLR